MAEKEQKKPAPPRLNPYVVTVLLVAFGLWCAWDGWVTTNPDKLEHATFNKVLSCILLPLAVWDFFKLRKSSKKKE